MNNQKTFSLPNFDPDSSDPEPKRPTRPNPRAYDPTPRGAQPAAPAPPVAPAPGQTNAGQTQAPVQLEGVPANASAETKELVQYLDEVINDYRRCVGLIGKMGYSAPTLLYYRDEVQDLIEALGPDSDSGVDIRQRWAAIRELDIQLRGRAQDFVREVGHANFKQYQIINQPPLTRWWWYLNRITPNLKDTRPLWLRWKG